MRPFNCPPGKKLSKAQQIAVGGIFSALALVVMLLGGVLPFATFVAPVFSGLFLIPVAVEVGTKFGLLAYAAVSVLSMLLVPDKELALLFIFFFGFYPILHPYLQRIRSKLLRITAKLVLFNLALALVYGTLYLLFGPAFFQQENLISVWFVTVLWFFGNLVFGIYDLLVVRLKFVYYCILRKRIFR